jgi:hypothetical protein
MIPRREIGLNLVLGLSAVGVTSRAGMERRLEEAKRHCLSLPRIPRGKCGEEKGVTPFYFELTE